MTSNQPIHVRVEDGLDQTTDVLRDLELVPLTVTLSDDTLQPWRYPFPAEIPHEFALYVGGKNDDMLYDDPRELHGTPFTVGDCLSVVFASHPSNYRLYRIQERGVRLKSKEPSSFTFPENLLRSLIQEAMKREATSIRLPRLSSLPRLLSVAPIVLQGFKDSFGDFSDGISCVITGERGSGKTHTAMTIAALSHLAGVVNVQYIDCRRVKESSDVKMAEILDGISDMFEAATVAPKSLLIFDDVDAIVPIMAAQSNESSLQSQELEPTEVSQAKLVADVIQYKIKYSLVSSVQILFTCESFDAVPKGIIAELGYMGRLATAPLSISDRIAFFRRIQSKTNAGELLSDSEVGKRTVGFRPGDFARLGNQASSLVDFVPLCRIGVEEEHQADDLVWSAIGGSFQAKKDLISSIVRPSMNQKIYENVKIPLPRGLLLFGFPGSGKTSCVKALASEYGLPLIVCRGPEILDKYIGASEAKVRQLFDRASAAAPSILFLDEIDSLAPCRGSDHTGVTDRVVNQLLTYLDGVERDRKKLVYVVGASSRPDRIDPALLRPGRLEKHVYFGPPVDREEAQDLLVSVAGEFQLDGQSNDAVVTGELLNVLLSDGSYRWPMVQAEVKSAFRSAELLSLHDAIRDEPATSEISTSIHRVAITHDRLYEAFRSATPFLSEKDQEELGRIYSVFRKVQQQSPVPDFAAELKTALK